MAARCARAGARLTVSDVDEAKRPLADRWDAGWSRPDTALEADVDVLVPCALGGLLNDESLPRLRCAAVAGAANNQLSEDRIAGLLQDRGILWTPDFIANAGGLINIAEEIGGYQASAARRRVLAIGETLGDIFARARADRTTPLAAALELAEQRLACPDDRRRSAATLSPGPRL